MKYTMKELKHLAEKQGVSFRTTYHPKIYNTPFKQFKIIQDLLSYQGLMCTIRSSKHALTRKRIYGVIVNMKYVKSYKTRVSAKRYIINLWLKSIPNGKEETKKHG